VLYFDGQKYVYSGLEKFIIVDMFFHVLILMYVYTMYGNYYSKNETDIMYYSCWGLLLLYLLFIGCKKIYGIPLWEMGVVFVVANVLYYLVFYTK
jgi:hypothetical protein